MEHEKKDRRVRRTRQLLQDALLALLKEKRYQDISVQDIIERADVARSTFYVHYIDKQDLLVGKWGVFASSLDQHPELMSHDDKESRSILPTRGWFYHIQAQSHILKIIARDSAIDLAMRTLQGIVHRDVEARIQPYITDDAAGLIPQSIIVDHVAISLMNLIKWWVKHDMSYRPEQMDEIFQQLVMPGVASTFKTSEGSSRNSGNT